MPVMLRVRAWQWWQWVRAWVAWRMARPDNDPYNNIVEDWRPKPAEVPDLFYIDGLTESEALRELADRLEKDDDLVLIGLWNIGYEESTVAHLQVVATHMESD